MEKETLSLIGARLSHAHELAYEAYQVLEELSTDVDINDVDALSELMELSNE